MMNFEQTERDDVRAEAVALQAQEAFDRAVKVLQDSCRQLEGMPDAGDGDVMKALRQMNSAFILTMDMREKARDAGCKRFGTGGVGVLDLDTARAEIGLRLACLRGPGGGGRVP